MQNVYKTLPVWDVEAPSEFWKQLHSADISIAYSISQLAWATHAIEAFDVCVWSVYDESLIFSQFPNK